MLTTTLSCFKSSVFEKFGAAHCGSRIDEFNFCVGREIWGATNIAFS